MAAGEQIAAEQPEELISFVPLEDGHGLEIVDHIERRHVSIQCDTPIDPSIASTDDFNFPVDRAIQFTAGRITLPHSMVVYVRNSLGFVVEELVDGDGRSFPVDEYSLDLTASVKLYIEFNSHFSIHVDNDSLTVDFSGEVSISIGTRSYHKSPVDTMETTENPADMMECISYFGSSLKTLNSERSFPTLRGHPPLIEISDNPSIPSVLSKPDTGVTIQIPEEYRYVFGVAPLAFYLGASVVPGERPILKTSSGFSRALDDPKLGFHRVVERVLKQIFLLDCITRTEGLYQVNLFEREGIEEVLDIDFHSLYQRNISSVIPSYLEIPYETIKPYIPRWKLAAYVDHSPENIEMMPFVVNDLAIIRSTDQFDSQAGATPLLNFDGTHSGRLYRRAGDNYPQGGSSRTVRREMGDTMEQSWIGKGTLVGTSKAMPAAFENRLDLRPTDADIDITVVCNDPNMETEGEKANATYESREDLPFNVEIYHGVSTRELREILELDSDFFHYIGHIDEDGFECSDGRFDAACLDWTGVSAFFLNACNSYEQGLRLIHSGSVAGVVTLEDIINSGAERIGETIARLLNRGFPIRVALDIASTQSIMGGHYLVLGDGSVDIAQSDGIFPISYSVRETASGHVAERIVHPHREAGMGSLLYPHIGGEGECYLASGKCGEIDIPENTDLEEVFDQPEIPIYLNGDLVWSNSLAD